MIKKLFNGKPIRTVVFYYIVFICLATFVLKLPFLYNDGYSISWLQAFFTSNSAIATTGLTLFDYTVTFNYLGWFVLIVLFNIGGMGIIVLNTLVIILLGKKVGYKHRNLAKADFNQSSEANIVRVIKGVFIFFITFEMIGTILIFLGTSSVYPDPMHRFMSSWFLSASAVSGSGFFNFAPFVDDAYIKWVTIVLMWISFIGFPVIIEAYWWCKNKIRGKSFTFSRFSKIVFKVNVITVLLFAGLFILIEGDTVMAGQSLSRQITDALFMSTSMKSVGLSVYADITTWQPVTLFLSTVFMLIGGSPSSACGGIKVVAIYIAFKYIFATFKGRSDVLSYNFIIPKKTVTDSFLLIFAFVGIAITSTVFISIIQPEIQMSYIWYDVVSAFTTTGFSTGALSMMNDIAIIIISILMGFGRIGIMNIMNLSDQSENNDDRIKYVEKNIAI